ncbi:hypothetical protein [Flavobacterium oreochromis]|uniref:DUF3592 domain-containing protein n=1 Tax=Flavobacterium oreochromis TaxID=2906078 RepID=A0ABW8PCD2_9FLAO|nr:hypothetical protein [Flavobacterium oreochromis]OWP74118.1 hypothetical protein BWG23_14930 [Flavobacterium oreochromis]
MKKTLIIVIIIIGFLEILTNVINDFEKYKVFYAAFYPKKYFLKDTLLFDYEHSPSSGGSSKVNYVYVGICKSDKLKRSLEISASLVEGKDFYLNRINHKIPIWRISIAKKEILYRNSENKIYSPFSYQMRNYWISTIISILFFPSLAYYLVLRINKQK